MRMDKAWLDIIKGQEEQLLFETFDRDDALQIGLAIINLARQKYKGDVAISIIEDNLEVFSHKMAATSAENEVWIFKKLNMCKATGVSSLRAGLEIESGLRKEPRQGRDDVYVGCGGGLPVKMKKGGTFAYIIVSGLEHYDDHQIIVDAVAGYLKIEVTAIGV